MDQRPIKIYATENVPRLKYIAGILLGDILGLTWEVVTDRRKLGKFSVINYSSETLSDAFNIRPDSLLFEKGVVKREISVSDWNGLPVFFQISAGSDLPFDIFAASFFLVSRYEEYLEFQPDEFGRFRASSSLAFQNGFLGIPIVDMWAKAMAKALLQKFKTITFKRNEYRALLTVDADQPFAYLGKSLLISLGGIFRDIKNRKKNTGDRYRVMAKEETDPYDVFGYMTEKIELYNSDACFFFPVGEHSRFDKNPSWKSDEYRKLILSIANKYKVGLHPSFNAGGNFSILNNEANRLRNILTKEFISSRFHYIRLRIPDSYREVLKTGITEDYSMGYPEEPGFRAGIARPFCFYDVSEDQQTNLKIVPFQVMDTTLCHYKHLDPVAAKIVVSEIISETRKAGGLFVSIWHNTSLLDNPEWQGWREVFELMLKNQKS